MIVADTDMLTDRMWVQGGRTSLGQRVPQTLGDKRRLPDHALDNLSGSEALISVSFTAQLQPSFSVSKILRVQAERPLSRAPASSGCRRSSLKPSSNCALQQGQDPSRCWK